MGRLSAALAPLTVAGPHIVNAETGAPVRLLGVNRSGLEYAEPTTEGFLDAAGITEEEIAEMVDAWHVRIIRLPLNQDFAINGRGGHSGEAYLAGLDCVIAWAAEHGAYTLLDLQWLDAERVFGLNGGMNVNRVPPLPDALSIAVWRTLAARYRDEPAVLFDLFNEPHNPLPEDGNEVFILGPDGVPMPIPTRHVGMAQWQPWARRLIGEIRSEHPAALIFVAGVSWAYDLRGMPLLGPDEEPLPNIVYNTHVYPWSRTRLLSIGPWEGEWDRAFGHLTTRVPVFAGEWGGGVEHVEWGQRLLHYFDAHDMGWCAWSWADWPHLVASCRERDYRPTAFGTVVKNALARERA